MEKLKRAHNFGRAFMEADHHSAEANTIQLENSSHPKRSDKSQTKYCQQKAGKSRQNKYRLISAKADITGTSGNPVHQWNIKTSWTSLEHQGILCISGTSRHPGHHWNIRASLIYNPKQASNLVYNPYIL